MVLIRLPSLGRAVVVLFAFVINREFILSALLIDSCLAYTFKMFD